MFRDDEDSIDLPLSSSAKALEGKKLHVAEKQKQKELKQKRDLLKLKMAVTPSHGPQAPAKKDVAPDTFGTKTLEQQVKKQREANAEKTAKTDELIQKGEEENKVEQQTQYEQQQQVG